MTSDFQFYLELFKKRLPVMLVIFLLCGGLGVGVALTMPPKYRADATLYVEGPAIDLETTVQSNATEQLQIIEQQLMTRSNLIDIANKHRVFSGRTGMTPDDVVEEMKDQTDIDLSAGRDLVTTMRISFLSGNANTSANVVNDMVTEVLRIDAARRQGETGETLEFFERRVDRINSKLAILSSEIVAYKEANKDALPEGLEFRMERQSTLQERVNDIASEKTSLLEQRSRLIQVGSPNGASPQQEQLLELEAELRWKLSVFSDENPKVRVLRSRIEQLKELMANGIDPSEETTSNPILDVQLAEIDSRLRKLEEDGTATEVALKATLEAIERTPGVGIQLDELERGYERAQTDYADAIASRSKAEQGVDVEDSAQGERVDILEQASVPSSPNSPNRKLIAGGGVFVGSALAALFFTLTELLNRTIRRPIDLTRGLGVQPLATLPFLEDEAVRRRRSFLKTFFVIGSLIAIPVGLWALHTFYLPLDLLFEMMLQKVGI